MGEKEERTPSRRTSNFRETGTKGSCWSATEGRSCPILKNNHTATLSSTTSW